MRTIRTALKGIGMIAIATSILFTACGGPETETPPTEPVAEPAPAPKDTNTAEPAAPVDSVKAAPADSVKK